MAKYRLGEEPEELIEGAPSELVAMVWPLTLDAWASMGTPIPNYDRAHAPGRLIRKNG